MLLGDADIKDPVGKALLHLVETGARGHGSGNRNNLVILFGSRHQPLGKDRGIAWRITGRFLLGTGDHIEFGHRMVFFGGRAGKGMALALFRDNMDQNGATCMAVPDVFQHRQKMRHVMPVNRANMQKAQLAEDRIAANQIARGLAGTARGTLYFGREF